MKGTRAVISFLLISLFSCAAVFQDAMWGRSIAAPVDIAPALWKHYQHVDPLQGPIPKNHYIVDQLSYDLPLQYLMHGAWRSGEIPWWNPYSSGGRPLLADAHCNGTDPIRLLAYFTFRDFVLAYNWTLILHAVGTGLGCYLLLRTFGARPWVAGLCALAAQWAGGYVLYIGHPWVRASFIYYPFLWMAGNRSFRSGKLSSSAPWWVAAIFYAGNLQSHTYLPIFTFCIAAGYAGRSLKAWWHAAKIIAPAGVLGAMLAAPVLLPQFELYLHAIRAVGEAPKLYWLETGAILGAIHPWIAGTFRTLSVKSVNGGPNFHLAIGGVLVVLALFGWARRKHAGANGHVLATAVLLVVAFLLIAFAPLHPILYLRAAGLGIIGLVVLAAWGAEALLRTTQPEPRWGRAIWLAAAALAVATALLAHVLYPRFQAKAESLLLARAEGDGYGGASRELRKFQAANFGSEVSPLNLECAFNLGALALLAVAFRGARTGAPFLGAACAVSLVPVLLFAERFIIRAPVETWFRLLEGGPAQKAVIAQVDARKMRFVDRAPQDYLRVFPQEIAGLHRFPVAHGYAALQPRGATLIGIDTEHRGPRGSDATARISTEIPRFRWASGSGRDARVANQTLSRLRVVCEPGFQDLLEWNDSPYPGWTVDGEPMRPDGGRSAVGQVLVPPGRRELSLVYQPALFRVGMGCMVAGVIATAWIAWHSRRRRVPTARA